MGGRAVRACAMLSQGVTPARAPGENHLGGKGCALEQAATACGAVIFVILGLSFEPVRLAQYGPRIGCFAAGLRFGLGSAPLGSAIDGVPVARLKDTGVPQPGSHRSQRQYPHEG